MSNENNPTVKQAVEWQFNEQLTKAAWMHEGNRESASGPGSTVDYTEQFREGFEDFISLSGASSLLDAPCGDFNWMKLIQFPSHFKYIGADIVARIIETNGKNYGNANRIFIHCDIISDPLPDADIWLCRDCLFHLPLTLALNALRNSMRSRFKYYMLTSHFNEINEDIHIGGFRELNLLAEPFYLPEPISGIRDYIGEYPRRRVGIWTRDQVLGALTSRL
ncbi:class I SAM-dependent methyltransferase [Methylobacterium oxalidis]|uniref:class I SAM-dependent methyltransferase n=1 Tax=Methylobacterium oxalidis TaxID=944322 RepID=UPI0033157147